MSTILQTAGLFVGAIAAIAAYLLVRIASDPQVIVYVKHDTGGRVGLMLIIIENIGRGVAHDVKFNLSRDIPRFADGLEPTGEKKESVENMSDGALIAGIPYLAPGERRTIAWGQYGGLLDSIGPIPVRVETTYEGGWPIRYDHRTESLLEVMSFSNDLMGSEEDLEKHLRQIATDVGSLGSTIKTIGQNLTD